MSTSETMMYDWKMIPWRKLEVIVFKLQKRIYQASRRGDMPDEMYAVTVHHLAEEPDEGKLSRPVLKTSANREVRA